ncbi:MAG: 5-methyltetrahydropteroyltriglutamate--homocysteine S-methyltransferase [Thermoguttaceae bacterium]
MAVAANLGFPRIGARRNLKWAVEGYWKGAVDPEELQATAADLRRRHWQLQQSLGVEQIPSNDFSLYDHVLDAAILVGAVPKRFDWAGETVGRAVYFAMARGAGEIAPLDMTKWFDTNYHYLAPEFEPGMKYRLASTKPIDQFREAASLGVHTRPVLLGPLSLARLGRCKAKLKPLALVERWLPIYEEVLWRLAHAGADWVQIDEPALALDLPPEAMSVMESVCARLSAASDRIRVCLTTYFGGLAENLPAVLKMPVAAVHLDLVRAPEQLEPALDAVPQGTMLSLGVVDGRNVWRTDLDRALAVLEQAASWLGPERLLVAPSCSLLHCPMDLDDEPSLDAELKNWMAFAKQKLQEVAILVRAINEGRSAVADPLAASRQAIADRINSPRLYNPAVRQRLASIDDDMLRRRSPYPQRRDVQRRRFSLPRLPTTTIGSFPQTLEVRKARAAFKHGHWSVERYEDFCRSEIERSVRFQEEIDLDVLVHGEIERADMVEYFGEQLEGFAFTHNGWVQSFGTRCVKPPVIFGDVSRPQPISVRWSRFAQSLTPKPMKAMLTGPITILQWSFVRNDQPRRDTAFQLALVVRDEAADLEAAGIGMIQIDEPGLREGLPLRRAAWNDYLTWAVDAFRLASSGVRDETQIHTHMCYAEFHDILESIATLDADVLSIEASRSNMELLGAFAKFRYPNDIGPGVYDIHSPRVPEIEEIIGRLCKAMRAIPVEQLWVNPDCGLKTRGWPEVHASLRNMVEAAKSLRRDMGQ